MSRYIGLGFRYLHNDLRTNEFRQGYRLDNFLTYIPVGLTHKTLAFNQHLLKTTIEYSHLIKNIQRSSLSDQNPTAQNVRLLQTKGYRLSFETLLHLNYWALSPVINY